MQDQNSKPFYDFLYGKYLLSDLFDISIQEDDYVERAYNIFREIGNIATAVHAFEFEIDNSRIVQLPCNAEFVEAVSTGNKSMDHVSNVIWWQADWTSNKNQHLPDIINNPNNNRIDALAQNNNLKPGGEFIDYELQGTIGDYNLLFKENQIGIKGVCIYRGICVDDQGNPLLRRKEAEAIAYKMAFIDTQKKMFMGDPTAGNLLQYIKMESGRKMAAAKIPEYMNQNEIDQMFSALTNHDRKVYWSSFKSVK